MGPGLGLCPYHVLDHFHQTLKPLTDGNSVLEAKLSETAEHASRIWYKAELEVDYCQKQLLTKRLLMIIDHQASPGIFWPLSVYAAHIICQITADAQLMDIQRMQSVQIDRKSVG